MKSSSTSRTVLLRCLMALALLVPLCAYDGCEVEIPEEEVRIPDEGLVPPAPAEIPPPPDRSEPEVEPAQPEDRGPDNPGDCAQQFEPELVCHETPETCTFHAVTDGSTCREYCERHGGACLAADHDLGGVSCDVESPAHCDEPAFDMLCTCRKRPELHGPIWVVQVKLLWGQLEHNPAHRGERTVWDGFAEVMGRMGSIELLETIRFEQRDEAHDDELPRVLRWRSRTTVHNDGVLMRVRVRKDDPEGRLVVQTEQNRVEIPLFMMDRYEAEFTVNGMMDRFVVEAEKIGEEPIHQPVCHPATKRLHILNEIDGRSRLIVNNFRAFYHHDDFAAPGRLNYHGECQEHDPDCAQRPEPTFINGDEWMPDWPGEGENRDCHCESSEYFAPWPLVPQSESQVSLNVIQARHVVRIVEEPSAENGYTFVIEFDDNPPGGDDWYEVEVVFDYMQCEDESMFWCEQPGLCEYDCAEAYDHDCDSCEVMDGGCVEGCDPPDPDCQ